MAHQLFRLVVAAIIHNGEGKFLLAQRSATDRWQPSIWAIPAGHAEAEGPLDAAVENGLEDNLRREVREEIGVEINIEQYLDSHFWIAEDYKKLTAVFLCTIASGEPKPLDETQEIRWLSLSELGDLNLAPQVLRLITKADELLKTKP